MVKVAQRGRYSVYVYDEQGGRIHVPHCHVRWSNGDAEVELPNVELLVDVVLKDAPTSVARGRIAPWTTPDYSRILSAAYYEGMLTVGFVDGTNASVAVDAFRDRPGTPDWERVTYTDYEIVVPRESDDDDEIPWDVIRSLTDPAYERYLAEQAATSAMRIGVRVRDLREGLRLTDRELAERSDIPLERLAAIETGTDGVSLPALERIVTAMGFEMDAFRVDDEDKRRA